MFNFFSTGNRRKASVYSSYNHTPNNLVVGSARNAMNYDFECDHLLLEELQVEEEKPDSCEDTDSQLADNIHTNDNFDSDEEEEQKDAESKAFSEKHKIIFPKVSEFMKSNPVLKEVIKQINDRSQKSFPSDAHQLFDSNCPNGVTVQEFSRRLQEVAVTHGFTVPAVNDILKLFRDTTAATIPTNEKNRKRNSGPVKLNKISDYLEDDKKGLPIDVCVNGCMAFFGTRKNNDGTTYLNSVSNQVDQRKEISCYKCGSPRFSPCSHEDCRSKSVAYEECNPFRCSKGDHSLSYRKPLQTVYHRSIIAKLTELYTLSCMDGYENILKYRTQRMTRDGCIIDAHDGTEVTKNYDIMYDNFKVAKNEFERNNPQCILEECSLGLTMSYDGVVNFKRKADSMWPMVCSVLDCNPRHRSKPGLGMFLTSLHNMSMSSEAEKFLMKECVTQELTALEQGMIFSFEDSNKKTRYVFLQARCMYAHLDTKGLEHFAKVKASGSKKCPLCNMCDGVSRKSLNKVTYVSCREGLHQHHYCRFVGQKEFEPIVRNVLIDKKAELYEEVYESAEERQINYYNGSESSQADLNELIRTTNLAYTADNHPQIAEPRVHIPPGVTPVWYNYRWPVERFKKSMRYPHPDTRPFKQCVRLSDFEYFAASDEAFVKRLAYINYLDAHNRNLPKTPKDCSVRGIHDICPLIESLHSFPFTALSWDIMHCLSNISGYKFKLYKGERFNKAGSRKLAVAQDKHPHLKYVQCRPPWETTLAEQNLMDAVMNSIILPVYYTADYSLKYPFRQTGFLKSRQHAVFMTVYESYLLSFTDIDSDYKDLAARLAEDIHAILNPCIDREFLLNDTIPSVDETRSVFLGMFPDSEQVFIVHQLQDIVRHIVHYGHIRSLSCYASERFNSFLSNFITKGGVHYLMTMYSRYVLKENFMTSSFCQRIDDDYNNGGVYSDFTLKLIGKPSKSAYKCCRRECNKLCDRMYQLLVSQEIDNLYLISPYYRLYTAYLAMKETQKIRGFWTWLDNLNEALLQNNVRCVRNYVSEFVVTSPDDYFTGYEFCDISSGVVYDTDFRTVADDLLPHISFITHNRVIIKGIKFKCRGVNHMNTMEHQRNINKRIAKHADSDISDDDPSDDSSDEAEKLRKKKLIEARNNFNDLSIYCTDRNHTNSWCLSYRYDVVEEEVRVNKKLRADSDSELVQRGNKLYRKIRRVKSTPEYGQLDFCFRLRMPSDKLLDGVAFGHITKRRAIMDDKRYHVKINLDHQCPRPHIDFVCLNYVCSTAIGLSVLDINKQPVSTSNRFSSFVRASTDSTHRIISESKAPLKSLYLIELHPERIKFEYGSLDKDIDGTKKREVLN